MEETILKTVPKGMEIAQPKGNWLTPDERERAIRNLLKFMATPTLAFLVAIQSGVSIQTAFSLALIPALINSLIDVITKWNSDTPYLRNK